jgi:hypothetical protein
VNARYELRADLERLPLRMLALRIDSMGWPVPFFAKIQNDPQPVPQVPDPEKMQLTIQRRLCYICGEKLGAYACFLAGPPVGVNRTTNEPPSHVHCARWMARNDSFLLLQDVVMLWTTKTYEVLLDQKTRGAIFAMGDPDSIEWLAAGKPATKDQIMQTLEAGVPALVALAEAQENGLSVLEKMLSAFLALLPD